MSKKMFFGIIVSTIMFSGCGGSTDQEARQTGDEQAATTDNVEDVAAKTKAPMVVEEESDSDNIAASVPEAEQKPGTQEESEEQPAPETKTGEGTSLAGTEWKGTLTNIAGGSLEEHTISQAFVLNYDGSVRLVGDDDSEITAWEQTGDTVQIFGENKSEGYFEYRHEGATLVFTKMVLGGEEALAGEDFWGGKAPVGVLHQQ